MGMMCWVDCLGPTGRKVGERRDPDGTRMGAGRDGVCLVSFPSLTMPGEEKGQGLAYAFRKTLTRMDQGNVEAEKPVA